MKDAGTHQNAPGRAIDVPQVSTPEAPFDNSRKALKFALNANQVKFPPAYLSRVLSEVPYTTAGKRAKSKALQKLRDEEAKAEAERRAGHRLSPGQWPASMLDRVHLAGYILHHFTSLDRTHQVVLTLRCTTPALECACGSPCCSGWRPVPRWVTAVNDACELLKSQAIAIANDGAIPGAPMKVGLSTQPMLRRQIVKDWARQNWMSQIDLARQFHLSALTVSRHRAWIEEWLDTQENNAWLDVDALFDRTGITGAFV